MPTETKMLKKKLEAAIQNIYFDVHAIYDPDGSPVFGDCYCAAVDLFTQGMTFRIYFKLKEDQIQVEHAERWYIG